MRTQINLHLKQLISLCIALSIMFSSVGIARTVAYATENNFEEVTLSLNSTELNDSSITLYLHESVHYISIDDLCKLTRCSKSVDDDIISVTQGFWRAIFDVEEQLFDDGYQSVATTILAVSADEYAVPALMFLSYFKAIAFIENDTLYCRMPEFTAWEALNVDYSNSLVDIYELYGGEGNVIFSLTLDIIMDFIMGDMSTSDDYLSDAFLEALKVDLYDYSSVQKYKESSQSDLYSDLHSDKGEEFVEAIEDTLGVAAEPTQWYIQYYYNAIEKSFVSLAYDAFEAGQHADVKHYGEKFYEAFTEKNKTSETAEKYFDNADYVMLFVSAAVDTAQQMKYTNATNNLVYNVMGQKNLNYLGISADDNDWFTVANRYQNVLGVAATQIEAEAMQLFTDKLCWETLIGTGVSSAAGISGGAWTFSLNFARLFVENFPLTSSSVESFKADRRALYLSELQQNVYWVAMNTLQNMQGQWDNPEIYTKYIQALQLYCRTSIAMYENLITMVDEFGQDRDYWTSLFHARIDMLAISLYQLTTLQDDGVNACLPLELASFTNLTNTDSSESSAYDKVLDMYYESISCNWTNCDNDGWNDVGDPDNACYILSTYEADLTLSEVGYSLLDLNNDGQQELIIALIHESGIDIFPELYTGKFYDLYTIVNGEVLHAVSAGERSRYNLAVDHSINNSGSSGAASSVYVNYRLDSTDGTLKINQAVVYDGWRDSENPYFYATTEYYNRETYETDYNILKPISDEEASAYLESFPDNQMLELIPFDQYAYSGKSDTVDITDKDQYALNIFLSNFSEQWFCESSTYDETTSTWVIEPALFISNTADTMKLVEFACLYLKLNSSASVEFISHNGHEYGSFSIESINSVTERFFNRRVSVDEITSVEIFDGYYDYIVLDNNVCFAWGDGETYNHMSVATKVIELDGDSIQVNFNIYSLDFDDNRVDAGGGITDKSVYHYSLTDAKRDVNFEFHAKGTAVLVPYTTESGKETYQLLSYEIISD